MSVPEPVLTGPGAGRKVTKSSGSSIELELTGQQAGGDGAVVECRLRAGDEPPISQSGSVIPIVSDEDRA